MQEKLIYIVDDEKEIREMEKIFLENEGYMVETFANADAMIAELEETFSNRKALMPDLVVMDIMMEGTDGLTACSRLRKSDNPILKVLPIILVSAKDTPLDRVTGLTMGSDDYLVKPFLPLELVARVKALIRRSELLELRLQNAAEKSSEGLEYSEGKKENVQKSEIAVENAENPGNSVGDSDKWGNNPLISGRNLEKCGNLVLDFAAHRVYVDLTLSEPLKKGDLRKKNVDKNNSYISGDADLTEENILEIENGSIPETGIGKLSLKREKRIEIQVTPLEFEFVHFLMIRRETAVSKADLLREVWHLPDAGLQDDARMTDDLVKRLRKKLKGANSTARVGNCVGIWIQAHRKLKSGQRTQEKE